MLLDEIVHTCSHEKVAHAAVASLGFAYLSRVKRAAEERGVSIGVFVAGVVREFGDAPAHERRAVDRAMANADQPVLRGLQTILERELDGREFAERRAFRSVEECGCSA